MRPLLDYVIGYINGESDKTAYQYLKHYIKKADRKGVIRVLIMLAGINPKRYFSDYPRFYGEVKNHLYLIIVDLFISSRISLYDLQIIVEFINGSGTVYSKLSKDRRSEWTVAMYTSTIIASSPAVVLEFIELCRSGEIYSKGLNECEFRKSKSDDL